MDTATCVFTCKYWFSISRITCLIIFSGSSARSIMSFRLARIRVPTRSKSPMVFLPSDELRMPRCGKCCRELSENCSGAEIAGDKILEARGQATQEVPSEKRRRYCRDDPDDQELLLDSHVVYPSLEDFESVPVSPPRLTGTEANITWWLRAEQARPACRRSCALC